MTCIVLVCGIIGAGKTTFINYLKTNESAVFKCSNTEADNKSNNGNRQNKMVKVCRIVLDELCSIEEQASMMNTLKGWKHFRVDLLMAAEHYINFLCEGKDIALGPLTQRSLSLLEKLEQINLSINSECNLVFLVEDNFYYRSMRYDWFQIARRVNVGFCEIFVKCETSLAILRNSQRGYSIPQEKISRMVTFMEYPEPEKYKWEKYSHIFNSENELEHASLKEVINCINEASDNPAEMFIMAEKIEAQTICSKNVVHQADNIIRKLVSRIVSSNKENQQVTDFKKLISDLVEVRQNLLHSIKQGHVRLPQNLTENVKNEGIGSVKTEFEQIISNLFEDEWNKKLFSSDSLKDTDVILKYDELNLPIKKLCLN